MVELDITGITFKDSSYRDFNVAVINKLSEDLQTLNCRSRISILSNQLDFSLFENHMVFLQSRVRHGYKKIVPVLFEQPRALDFAKRLRRKLNVHKNLTLQRKLEKDDRFKILKELSLTTKHIKALSIFLDGNSEYLLVLEDDATPTSGLDQSRLISLVDFLIKHQSSAIYLDLCQHFETKNLSDWYGVSEESIESNFIKCTFFSNTTVAYVISRKAAEIFLSEIQAHPEFQLLAIDWLFTYIGRRAGKTNGLGYYVVKESFFANGSLI